MNKNETKLYNYIYTSIQGTVTISRSDLAKELKMDYFDLIDATRNIKHNNLISVEDKQTWDGYGQTVWSIK